MSRPSERDVAEALDALQRLHRHGILPVEDAREAARLLTGDDSYDFPSAPAAAPATDPPRETPS